MKEIAQSFYQALHLIATLDGDVWGIIGLTLMVTIISTMLAGILGVPLGLWMGSRDFRGRKVLVRIVNTLMGLPPVVAGLLVYLLLSRKGPLGAFSLLFTPAAMVIAQTLIITPIVAGLTIAAVRLKAPAVDQNCRGLGLSRWKTLTLLVHECRYPIISAALAGYGRAVSEVGAVMLVGGNIQYHTRVMTTAIVLETGKGNYDVALALGILLLLISFLINWAVQRFQEGI